MTVNRRERAATHARLFRALHVPGAPLVLFNVWDAASAMVVASQGARALATSSAAVGVAHGYGDGEGLPLWLVAQNVERISARHDLPLTVDIESGYGALPRNVTDSVMLILGAGACGFNIEDQVIGKKRLFPVNEQAERIAAARDGAQAVGVDAFINARTDVFLQNPAADHGKLVDDAIARGRAYREAGADGLFVPGLTSSTLITLLCRELAIPINVMIVPNLPERAELARAGVARISYGFAPMQGMIRSLTAAAKEALQ